MNFKDRLLPVRLGSGFRMEGYFIWCGSMIRAEDGRCYLFAARWPKETKFPEGYMTHSEIVLASADAPDGEFRFERVILGRREEGYWDSMMAHNPYITKIGDEYVLFYIGTPDGSYEKRAIGYAYSKSLTDGWVRADKPLDLPPNANNPAVLVKDDGVYLYFRDGNLRVSVARADTYRGPYTVLNDNLCPKGAVEDMFVYREGDRYAMLAEDAVGAYTGLKKGGVRFLSDDAVHFEADEPAQAYDFDILYEDGSKQTLQRRERPFLLFEGEDTYLFTTAKVNGETVLTGGDTWNMVQKLKREN